MDLVSRLATRFFSISLLGSTGYILGPVTTHIHSLCSFQSTKSMVSIHFDPTFLGGWKNPGLCLTKSYQPLILAKRYGNPLEMDVSHRENHLRSGWVFHICVSMTIVYFEGRICCEVHPQITPCHVCSPSPLRYMLGPQISRRYPGWYPQQLLGQTAWWLSHPQGKKKLAV